jgi:hypothetical protein
MTVKRELYLVILLIIAFKSNAQAKTADVQNSLNSEKSASSKSLGQDTFQSRGFSGHQSLQSDQGLEHVLNKAGLIEDIFSVEGSFTPEHD